MLEMPLPPQGLILLILRTKHPRIDSNLDGSRKMGNTTGAYDSTGQPSLPGGFPLHDNPYSAQELDPRLGGPTITTGPGSTGTGYNTIGQRDLTGPTTMGTADHHLGRDATTVGTAGAVGEGIHHRRENERGAPGTGFSDNTGVANTSSNITTGPHKSNLLNKLDLRVDSDNSRTIDNNESTHHYGRDAAAVGCAAAVGEGIHHHRENERERENLGSLRYSGTTPSGPGSAYYGDPTGTAVSDVSGPHTTSTANRLDPAINQNTQPIEDDPVTGGGGYAADEAYGGSRHHPGRDVVIGAGGIGLAEHEHRKREREREAGVGSSTSIGSNTGVSGDDSTYNTTTGTTGHHYGRDAAVGSGGVGLAEHGHRRHERERESGLGSNTGIGSNTGAYGDNAPYDTTTGSFGHHYGRDAAVGVGGVGLAEHEHRKHEREREGEAGLGGSTGTGPAPNTAGPHSKDWMNRLDPRVNANPDSVTTGTTGYSTRGERDATAGAGLTGAAGCEAERRQGIRNEPGVGQGAYDETLPDFRHVPRNASAIGAATALDENEKARLRAARGETRDDYDPSAYGPGYDPTATGPIDSPHGVHHYGRDGAGAATVGGALYEADKHHEHDKDLTTADREEKRELKHEEEEARRENKEEKKHGGLLSFLQRDKNKKYTKEEEEEFDRQEREYNNRHSGRDAALGGAAVGGAAVGGAAYEAERHHGHHRNSSGELDTMKPLPVAPGNNGIGTGEGTQNALIMDRKRGEGYDMDFTTGTGHHCGRDAAVGAGAVGLAEHEHRRHEREHEVETGGGYGSNTTAGATGTAGPHSSSSMNKLDPRVDSTTGAIRTSSTTTGGYGSTTGAYGDNAPYDDTTGTAGHPLSQGSDAYQPPGTTLGDKLHGVERNRGVSDGMTGAGSGIGYGANDRVPNMLGASNPSERSVGYAAPEHNVLHKDPPPNQPAARAMEEGAYYPKESTNY